MKLSLSLCVSFSVSSSCVSLSLLSSVSLSDSPRALQTCSLCLAATCYMVLPGMGSSEPEPPTPSHDLPGSTRHAAGVYAGPERHRAPTQQMWPFFVILEDSLSCSPRCGQ